MFAVSATILIQESTHENHRDLGSGRDSRHACTRAVWLRFGHQDRTEHKVVGEDHPSSETSTSAKAAPSTAKVAPRDEDAAGPNPTIASYIAENKIQETPVKRGDPGSPTIDLPIPDGWEPAGEDTPEWAYGAIVYTGPEAAEYTPSLVAMVSKLTGNVDPQAIIDLAPGELQNLEGWSAMNEGEVSTLGDYPAYQLGGTWESGRPDQDRRAEDGGDSRRRRPLRVAAQRRRPGEPEARSSARQPMSSTRRPKITP